MEELLAKADKESDGTNGGLDHFGWLLLPSRQFPFPA
jgi:hypothetical protein